jgi:site-specific DNA-cytosine methylase
VSVVEFCCGYGGASAGIINAGFEIEKSYDNWQIAVDAHKRWHPTTLCELRDVKTIEPEELKNKIVWASLPCQPWSTANRARRGKSHSSYYSLSHFAHQVQFSQMAILENGPGLLHEKDVQAELRELEIACAQLGLSLSINIIPAAWFGVMQLRRRAIILINAPLTLFSPAHQAYDNLEPSVRSTFGGGRDSETYKASVKLSPAPTATEGKNSRFSSDGTWSNQAKRRAESLSRTATTSGYRPDTRDRTPNYEGRTPAMNAELQGVPLEHIAHLPKSHQFTLIGNAVPAVFAAGVMQAIFGGAL